MFLGGISRSQRIINERTANMRREILLLQIHMRDPLPASFPPVIKTDRSVFLTGICKHFRERVQEL